MHVLNPWYLAGLAAVALPILIHILQRDRIKRVIFPATRFLLGASRKITRTQALRELILLILRALVLALLALALARPFFMSAAEEAAATGSVGDVAVLLVDTSASMRVGSRLADAKAQAQQSLKKFRNQIDRVAVVSFDSDATVVESFTPDLQRASAAIDALEPRFGGTNLVVAIQKAGELLANDDYRNNTRKIILISDLHRSGWSFHGERLPPGVELDIKPAALTAADNVAITQVSIPKSTVVSARNEPISLQVVNFGKQDRKSIRVTLTVEGTKVDEKFLNVAPGKTEVVRFTNKFEKSGDCTGVLAVEAADDFQADNAYFFNVRVLPRVQLLMVNGGPDHSPVKDDGRFVKEALLVPGSPFQIRDVQPQSLEPKDLEGTQAVILTNVGALPQSMLGPLQAFVRNGGGVMIFVGDRCLIDEFNDSYSGLAPCKLKQVVSKDDKSEGWTIGEVDFQHPIFANFAMPQSGDFTTAKFDKYFTVTDSQAARVLARYIEGPPALLEQPMDKGFVLLFTSSAGMKWNDFCLKGGIFVPFVHEALKHLSVHSEGLTGALVGEALPFKSQVAVIDPEGKPLTSASGASALLAAVPGIHTVKYADREERLAINVPRVESEPAMIDAQELAAALESNPEGQVKKIEGRQVWVTSSDSVRERVEAGQKLGWYLLWALLVLLFAEHILANNTSRR